MKSLDYPAGRKEVGPVESTRMRNGGFSQISYFAGSKDRKNGGSAGARQVSAHGPIDQYDAVVLNYRERVVAGLDRQCGAFFYMDGPFKPAV